MKAEKISPKYSGIIGKSNPMSNQELLISFLKRFREKFGYFSLFAAFPAVLTSFGQTAQTEDLEKPKMLLTEQNRHLPERMNKKRSSPQLLTNQSNYLLPYQSSKFDFISQFAGNDNCPGTPIPIGNYTAAAPFTDIGDTTGANNTVNSVYCYYCNGSAAGPDLIYQFKVTSLGPNPQIQVSATSPNYRPLIYLLNNDWGSCPAGTNNSATNSYWWYNSSASPGGTATIAGFVMETLPLDTTFYLFIDSQNAGANDSGGYTLRIQDVNIASTTPPSTPINVMTAPVSSSQINLNWNVNPGGEGVTGYNLRVNSSNVITGITSLPHAVINLTPNTIYTFEVQAVNAAGVSGWSAPVSAATLPLAATAPTGLSAIPFSISQINTFWNANPTNQGVTSYNLRVNGGTPITGITALSHAVTGLALNTNYTFEVQAVNSLGVSAWSNPVTATPALQPPPRVVPRVVSSTQIDAFWDFSPGPNVVSYQLRINGTTIISNINFLSWAVRDLTPGTAYSFEVRAIDGAGNISAWTPPVNAATHSAIPNAPATVVAHPVSTSQINVFWDASTSPNAAAYNLRVNGSTVIPNITYLSFPVKNLTPNTSHTFEVQTIDSSGALSAWTNPVTATTPALQPPPRVSPQTVSTTQINVFWDASPSTGIVKYNLRINGSTIIPDITYLSYAVRNLTPGTNYSFEVQAVDIAGNVSAWSSPVTVVTQALLPPPLVSPQTVSSTQINVFWDASPSPGITKYNLRINGTTVISDIAFLSYAVRNLNPNTTYSFEVQAVNAGGFVSAWSSPVSATTAAAPLPSPRVSPQVVSSSRINVFWDASPSANVVGYNLRVNGATVIPNIAFLSYAVTGLTPNTTYSFEVQTIDTGGAVSNWTTPVNATTLGADEFNGLSEVSPETLF